MATKKPAVPKVRVTRNASLPAGKKQLLPGKGTVKPKATPKPTKTLPSMAEFKKSAAYNSMSYKEYLDSFRARGYK